MDVFLKLLDELEEVRAKAETEPRSYDGRRVALMCKNLINTYIEYQLHSDWQYVFADIDRKVQHYDGDYIARCCSAVIAWYAGYDNRADWTDALLEQEDSLYFQRFKESNAYYYYLERKQKEQEMRLFVEELLKSGATVWQHEDFSYSSVQKGDYVVRSVVDDAINMLPPASMSMSSTQIGEPYSMRKDPDRGKWRNTYATFRYVAHDIWQYCGHCFCGENVERGEEPSWM